MKQTEWRRKLVAVLILAAFQATGCAPKIYIVDRQTVLEQEAAGEWPQFEKELVKNTVTGVPSPFPSIPVTEQKKRLYNVLNGDLVSHSSKSQR